MSKKRGIKISDSLEDLISVKPTQIRPKPKNIVEGSQNKMQHGENFTQSSEDLPPNVVMTEENTINFIDSPPKFDSIPITGKAFDEIIMMAHAVNEISIDRWGPDSSKLEVYCYVLGDKLEKSPEEPQCITGIYIPYHKASETNVTVSEEAILEVKEYIEADQKVVLGWAHSHGHYAVYSSQTDEVNHMTLLYDTTNHVIKNHFQLQYVYGITVNDKSERIGIILTKYPCGHIQRAEDNIFSITGESYSQTEFLAKYQEVKAIVSDRVTIKEPGPKFTKDDQIESINDELMGQFVSKLHRAKNLLIDKIPAEMDQYFDKIQGILAEYDELVLDSVEESFKQSSKGLIKALKNLKDLR